MDIFLIFLRLGLTSFGGPVAHLGYFRDEFVARRQWLDEKQYADLIALCQFLPGPASSQVGLAIGISQASYRGALAAWLGFTLPSALLLIGAALGITYYNDILPSGALHGLKIVAVAVVAQAVWGMARSFCTNTLLVSIMAIATGIALSLPFVSTQVGIIIMAAIIGLMFCNASTSHKQPSPFHQTVSRRSGLFWLMLFAVLLFGLPLLTELISQHSVAAISAYFQSGALVFGGGHVVLPLLQAEVVPTGWVNEDSFLAGYGMAQAVPGPLFTFAAFLGASSEIAPSGFAGGMLALLAIFAPSFLLIAGALPFWEKLRHHHQMQKALTGVNAAVVGLLLAALYNPVWTSAIHNSKDFTLALLALIGLMFWKCPPWLAVVTCGLAGAFIL